MRWRSRIVGWAHEHVRNIALAIWLICLLLFAAAMVLNALILLDIAPGGRLDATNLYYELGFLALATFGALIVARWPDQVMGWLFCAVGVISMITSTALTYEQFAGAESLPLLTPILLIAAALEFSHILIMLTIVPLLYPTGRLLSHRWRPLLVIAVATIFASSVIVTISTRVLGVDDRQENSNPAYVTSDQSDVVGPLFFMVVPLFTLIAGVVSLGLRYRRSAGVERLQIRWLLWILGVIMTLIPVLLLANVVTPSRIDMSDNHFTVYEITLGMSILALISIGIPAVLGLAILRYKLYSIDRIVSRTLVYGALTLGLGAIYWGGVVLLQQVLAPIAPSSNLSVAGSTLAVAALFQPLRRWIQDIVDRRFFRHKYDAATTIEAFGAQLRDAVDLDTLIVDLQVLVEDTMQPASVALWLRPQRHLDRA